jgi:ABC-type dipeptide/oligopeptide/nickel transport system permease subunit
MTTATAAPAVRRRPAASKVREFLRSPAGAAASIILLIFIAFALFGSQLAPYPPAATHPADALQGPSAQYWFGTDELGRDQLSRVIDAGRVAVIVAFASVGIALLLGTAMGVTAGYIGGWTDKILVRVMDVMFSFPALLLAIVIVAAFGSGLLNAVGAIGIVYTPRFARVARGATLTVKSSEYIEAARLAGVSNLRIVFRHILGNILAPLTVMAALSMSTAQLAYAALSFLGLGVNPPQADYGSMLSRARDFMTFAPWLVIFPAIALIVLIVGFNLFGDALRDLLDPRSGHEGADLREEAEVTV